jgi:hypothetical protein
MSPTSCQLLYPAARDPSPTQLAVKLDGHSEKAQRDRRDQSLARIHIDRPRVIQDIRSIAHSLPCTNPIFYDLL